MPEYSNAAATVVPDTLHALGVLVPVSLNPIRVLPGRHPLGRAGDGMRLLRTRPFISGEDNPRDIDKFSSPDKPSVIEWENEARASHVLLVDTSASMATPQKAGLRNACVLQLTYSMWRAGDRVSTILFDSTLRDEIRAANLKAQLARLSSTLARADRCGKTDVAATLKAYLHRNLHRHSDVLFIVSDFVRTDVDKTSLHDEWRPILNHLHRDVIPVIVSFAIPSAMQGLVKLHDSERQSRQLTWLSNSRIGAINRSEKRRVRNLINCFREMGLDYMLISNQQQIYPQLDQLARDRRKRGH